jgi:hypothetical protein
VVVYSPGIHINTDMSRGNICVIGVVVKVIIVLSNCISTFIPEL